MILDLSKGGHCSTPPKEGEVWVHDNHDPCGIFSVAIKDPRDGMVRAFNLNFLAHDLSVSKSLPKISMTPLPKSAIIVSRIELNE